MRARWWRYGLASFTLGPHWLHNRGLKKPEGSTHAGQGKAGTQLSDSQKTVMHFFFFFLGNGKKIYPSSRDESIQVVTGGFRILEGVQMTTTTPQCGIYLYLLRWFNELLNLENRSSSESVMIITGQRDWRTATEFLSLSSLVCLVRSKTAGLDTL